MTRLIIMTLLALLTFAGSAQSQSTDTKDVQIARKKLRVGLDTAKYVTTTTHTINSGSTHRMLPTAKAVYDAIIALGGGGGGGGGHIILDDDTVMDQQPGLNFISTPTVGVSATNDVPDEETEIRFSVPNDGIGSNQIAADAVGSSEISAGAVGNSELASNAVDSTKIAQYGVSLRDIAQEGASNGQVLKWNGNMWLPQADETSGGSGGYATVQEEGTGLTQRDKLNFVGASFTAADDAGNSRTNVTADSDLNALANTSTTGLYAVTAVGSSAPRTITAPAAGITVTNGNGVSGNPTLALANDLGALEGLSGTGIAVRTTADTWANRSIASGAGISVTNGDGVSGNPTIVNTGDTDGSDDITTASNAGGDVSGAFNNLQLGSGVVGTTELANLAVTNAKINDVAASKFTSGTVPSGFTMTATNNGTIDINYNSASAAFLLDELSSAAGIYSEDGTQYCYVDNVSTLIGSGTTNMQYIDGVLRLNDSDLTNYVAIKPPATANLTANYTLTLPVDDGTADQVLKTDGSGNLSWTTVSGGGGGDVSNNGNSFAADFIVGSNDNNTVSLEQNGTTFLTGGTDKNVTLINSVAATAATTDRLKVNVNSTGTAANGFGSAILFNGESSTTDDQEIARMTAYWATASHAAREGAIGFQLGDNGGALAEIAKFDRFSATGRLTIGTTTPLELTNGGVSANTNFILLTGANTMSFNRAPATTNSTVSYSFNAASTGTAGNGFGARLELNCETSTNAVPSAAYVDAIWSDATNATRTSDLVFSTVNSATIGEAFKLYGNKRAQVGGGTNNASAAFQVNSTTGGVLNPRVTTTEMNAIASPVEGLEVYNTTEKGDFRYDGSNWRRSSMDNITGRATGQTAAVASVATLTVGSNDASYNVTGNITVTTTGSESFSLQVDYTDETNTARTVTIPILRINTGAWLSTTVAVLGNTPYPATTINIRCKASTAITIKTSGTFTGCTYNVEGSITRIQ